MSDNFKALVVNQKGENFTKGSVLFNPGECLTAEKISLCASAGVSKIEVYKKLNLKDSDQDLLIENISKNPILLERPIVVKGEKAIIGRPPENVIKLL